MAAAPFKVRALYEYTSNHEDDLPFNVGQIITVTEVEDADWYVGEYVDDIGVKQEGIFPQNFVEKFEPTAPPRPTRTRKKEAEPAAAAPPVTASEPPPDEGALDTPSEELHQETPFASPHLPRGAEPRSPEIPSVPVANPPVTSPVLAPAPVPSPIPVEAKSPEPATSSSTAQPLPKAMVAAKSGPPVSEKPAGSSFKDRIAAFNKPAAPPVAPFKPGNLSSGSSGFIKKPFVAPPPSRNAYVPPPRDAPTTKVYRRDEDPEIKEREAESPENAENAGLLPAVGHEGQDEDRPKPTTLKERIALLQRQQAEAAQRQADTAGKKEKPKRPPKKRTESEGPTEATVPDEAPRAPSLERRDTAEIASKKSFEESRSARQSLSLRRRSTQGPAENDGNEADMSGAGDTTEGQEDLTEREDSDEKTRTVSRAPTGTVPRHAPPEDDEEDDEEEGEAEEEEEEEEDDPEYKRKQELRARMAKMSGGMGMAGMFGPPGMMSMGGTAPSKKPKATPDLERRPSDLAEAPSSPRAPPIPTMMALPGMSKRREPQEEDKERIAQSDDLDEPVEEQPTLVATGDQTSRLPEGPPPIPGGRPAPPPVPAESRPPPPPPPAPITSPSIGSESDDELSEHTRRSVETPRGELPPTGRAPPPIPLASPRLSTSTGFEGMSPSSPTMSSPGSKRNSRPPPPVPSAAPPPPMQGRPPPPPPPPGGPLSRTSTSDVRMPSPMKPGHLDNSEEGEVTEYEGDYDTDIASSAPHKDALKSHARDSSLDDGKSVSSPVTEGPSILPPPVPSAAASRLGPPPIPSQPPPPARSSADGPRAAPLPPSRPSVDAPRAAPPPPPPPPPPKQASYAYNDEGYDPYNYNAMRSPPVSISRSLSMEGEASSTPDQGLSYQSPPPPPPGDRRGPPPAPPTNRAPPRKSLDVPRTSGGRRSIDASRPATETGYMANDIDLAVHTQWWLTRNGLPPVFQGRRDVYSESDESTSSAAGGRTAVTKEVFVLFPDYSQTVITIRFDPQDPSNVELDQRHEPPPRTLRQDQLEQAYEQFGRRIASAVASKKDSVVSDGSPQALVSELLRPLDDVLSPIGTRAYGALVYANLANASTQTNDEIRPGDILSIRNAKFQGKHGPMHAKYTAEVGKPDHVAIVAEWDGTKKKVRAWEQGRESKKVKQESFKLEDLRSGEVKIWRVMPRRWVGWSSSQE